MTVEIIVKQPSLATIIQISDQARDQAELLLDQMYDQGPDASRESQIAFSKTQNSLLTTISHLRGLHRAGNFLARETKAQTTEARHDVDRLHLQLQNLYYEQRHLEGEIAACESFDHKYRHLALKPVEEFLAEHPEHADDDEDALMVARIENEHAERKALDAQRQEAANRRATLIAENKMKKEYLANLDRESEKFIDGGKRVEELFEKVI